MFLTIIGKEFVIINEELAIYFSFIIVLTILISNFGSSLSQQFKDQSNKIAESYSVGAHQRSKKLLSYVSINNDHLNFLKSLLYFEISLAYQLINLQKNLVIALSINK